MTPAEIARLTESLAYERRRADEAARTLRELREGLRDAWARYQRDDLSCEEFEGFIAERAE